MEKDKKNVLTGRIVKILKKLSPWIVICFIPHCLNMAGIVTWRNQNQHHFRNIWNIIFDALDNNKILDGLKLVLDEFIFNFTSIGAWIEFVIFLMIQIVLLKIIIVLLPYIPTITKAIVSAGRKTICFFRNIKQSVKKINVFKTIEYSLRYHLIPAYTNHHSIICLSTMINNTKYFGGVKADNTKFPELHLISYNGREINCLLDKPVLIIQTSSEVFLCGHGLIDNNGTSQRKIRLSHIIQNVTIGENTFEIYVEKR